MKPAPKLNRRNFLKTTAGALLAAPLGAALSGCGAGNPRIAVACRDVLLKATGQPDCWSAMKWLGLTGVEVDVKEDLSCHALHHPENKYTLETAGGIAALKDDLQRSGLSITAFCMHNQLDKRLDMEVDWTKKIARAAQQIGVGVIRIDVVPRVTPADQFLPFAVTACKQLCAAVADTPVKLGVENHGRVTNDPAFLDKLFDGVASDRLGLTLDAMNFYWFGHPLDDLYAIYKKFASRTFHTHCKNLRYPEDKRNARREIGWEYAKHAAPLYEGDIDYARFVEILRAANYRGDLCIENECLKKFPADQQGGVLKKEAELLNKLV